MKNYEAQNRLMQFNSTSKGNFGAKIALVLAGNKRLLMEKIKDLEDVRMGWIDKYCKRGSDGKPISKNGHTEIQEDKQEEFNGLYKDLMSEDCDVEFKTFGVELLDQFKDLTQEQAECLLNYAVETELPEKKLKAVKSKTK